MTAFEQWLESAVKIIVGDMQKDCEPDWSDCCAKDQAQLAGFVTRYERSWTDLEQRAAITLVQARALQCRHLAGEFRVNNTTGHPMLEGVAQMLMEQSQKLEAIGMRIANQWPIPRLEVVSL